MARMGLFRFSIFNDLSAVRGDQGSNKDMEL
jgi:hypothetical protein